MKQNRILSAEYNVCHRREPIYSSEPYFFKDDDLHFFRSKNETNRRYCPECAEKASNEMIIVATGSPFCPYTLK